MGAGSVAGRSNFSALRNAYMTLESGNHRQYVITFHLLFTRPYIFLKKYALVFVFNKEKIRPKEYLDGIHGFSIIQFPSQEQNCILGTVFREYPFYDFPHSLHQFSGCIVTALA